MPEPTVLHVCPHCERVFDSPSICMESGEHTVPRPMVVPSQTFKTSRGDCDADTPGWRLFRNWRDHILEQPDNYGDVTWWCDLTADKREAWERLASREEPADG